MERISQICGLSRTYTNHSTRVTSCTMLGENFTENEIKTVSGHKSLSCLGIYKRTSEEKREQMSDYISSTLDDSKPSTSNASLQVIPNIAPCIPTENQISNLQVADTDLTSIEPSIEWIDDFQLSEIDFNKIESIEKQYSLETRFVDCTFHNCSFNL